MAFINKQDTDGTKGQLTQGELGFDAQGTDKDRVYVGNTGGTANIPLAKKTELTTKADKSYVDSKVPTPTYPADEGLALVAHTAGNAWEKILGLPLETGNKFQTVTNKGTEGDSYWSPFVSSPIELTENFTLEVGQSASIVSPTLANGKTITIPVGSKLVIL